MKILIIRNTIDELVNLLSKQGFNYVELRKSVIPALEELSEFEDANTATLLEKWSEDDGSCLWWDFPIEEPPYCGTPLDDDFPEYKTHFTKLIIPY